MPHITKVLGQEAGLQFQGVKDKTGSTGQSPVNGVLVGSFKRGRLDQTMTVTLSNINAMIGYDPENPDYVTVLDYLNTGVPSVQVLRLFNESEDDCLPTQSIFGITPSEFGNSPDGMINFIYELDIIENGQNYQTLKTLRYSNNSIDAIDVLNTLLTDLGLKGNNSYAFIAEYMDEPIEQNGKQLFGVKISGVKGTSSKYPTTLTLLPATPLPESSYTYNLFSLFSETTSISLHSCGFDKF